MPLVLVVEDDRDILNMVQAHLELEGFDVMTACNGREALDRIAEKTPGLVVLDIMLPVIDGWEVLLQLRDEPETEAIPVVILTAKSEDLSKLTAFRHGADDYLTKPFNAEELVARIKALLKRTLVEEKKEPAGTSPVSVRIPAVAGDKTVLMTYSDIFFCRNFEGKTYLHTYDQVWPTKYSLLELEDRLPPNEFFRCHRSYLVNLEKVKEISSLTSRGCLLTVGDASQSQVPVSRRSIKELRTRLSL